METKLTPRDVWILSLLPLAAAAVLAWMWAAPLCRDAFAQRRVRASLDDAETLRARAAAAKARSKQLEAGLDDLRAELAAEAESSGELLPPDPPPPVLARLKMLAELCRETGVQTISWVRVDAQLSGSLESDGLPVDGASEYWCFRVRATLGEVAELLRRVERTPSTLLVDSVAAAGTPLPDERMEWTMTLWL